MRRSALWLALAMLLSLSVNAAESVQTRVVSLSPQVFPATARHGISRLEYRISISAFSSPFNVNNELAIATGNHNFSHEGFFLLEDPQLFETIPISFVLDVPLLDDENGNGIGDFFDIDAAVEDEQTAGLHEDGFGGAEQFTARWNRSAGQAEGTVVLNLPFLGLTFTHPMSLLNFDGALEFTRQTNILSGGMMLTNSIDTNDFITGPFTAAILSTNQLSYEDGTWTGPDGLVYNYFLGDELDRIGASFVSVILFQDGWPASPEQDYQAALLVLMSEDADGNGILDLVENPAQSESPRLQAEKTPEGLRLTIFGQAGSSYTLESSSSLPATNWQTEQTVTLTSEQASITLHLNDLVRFFRLLNL